jgi:hypothetical protein
LKNVCSKVHSCSAQSNRAAMLIVRYTCNNNSFVIVNANLYSKQHLSGMRAFTQYTIYGVTTCSDNSTGFVDCISKIKSNFMNINLDSLMLKNLHTTFLWDTQYD